jgi:hypothetical protein
VSGPGLEEAVASVLEESSLGLVLTTNLYGLPDRVAELRVPCYRPTSRAWSTLRQRSST